MTADDPRVQWARGLAETYTVGRMDSNIGDDLLESVRDLLAVMDEQASVIDRHAGASRSVVPGREHGDQVGA